MSEAAPLLVDITIAALQVMGLGFGIWALVIASRHGMLGRARGVRAIEPVEPIRRVE